MKFLPAHCPHIQQQTDASSDILWRQLKVPEGIHLGNSFLKQKIYIQYLAQLKLDHFRRRSRDSAKTLALVFGTLRIKATVDDAFRMMRADL